MTNISVVLNKFYDEYVNNTPKKLKIIDAYLFYIVLTGVIQFVYCCLVGSFPFNSFLSGFISTVSCFILGGILINNKLFDISRNWTGTNFNLFHSLPSSTSQPTKQITIQWNFAGKRIRRFYISPHYTSHCRDEFYWISPGCLKFPTLSNPYAVLIISGVLFTN